LSGRLKSSGRILLNGSQLNKSLRRQICYVLQNDVFFSNLTLRQTLVYAAMLRLPDSMSHEHKMRQVDQVIEALDLKSCQNTIIGDSMRRGLSGGEKKRCSIACELLSNPAVMMLDEPTSSLDSCTALSLVKLLKQYAMKEQKTIIISIHQPSSQIFYLFDKLLLLSRGQMMYFGSIQQVLPYFQHFNYHMQHLSYNPADFLMEVIKSVDEKELTKLAQEARECYFSIYKRNSLENNMSLVSGTTHSSPNGKAGNQLQHQFVSPHELTKPNNHHLQTNNNNSCHNNIPQHQNNNNTTNSNQHHQLQMQLDQHHHHHHLNHNHHHHETGHDDLSSSIHSSWSKIYIYDDHDDGYSYDEDYGDQCCKENKWPSSFTTQLYALTSRNFIDGKARMLSKLNWVQTLGLALIAGAIWFQVKRTEETLTDIKGWMYFSTMYWMMFALFNAMTSFPAECQVINKERKYKAPLLAASGSPLTFRLTQRPNKQNNASPMTTRNQMRALTQVHLFLGLPVCLESLPPSRAAESALEKSF